MVPSRIRFRCTKMGTPDLGSFNEPFMSVTSTNPPEPKKKKQKTKKNHFCWLVRLHNQDSGSCVRQVLFFPSERVGRPGEDWARLQLGIYLYSYIMDLFGDPYSLTSCPLNSQPNPHLHCACIRGCVWILWLVSSGKDALFVWEKFYREMLWRAFLWYLHVSSLFDHRPPVYGNNEWPLLNHPGQSPYPIQPNSYNPCNEILIDYNKGD